ncbi:MAG: hypothetical protein MRY74_03165 [Neomegalonema sp.]|nr:hypothetical protein [Neomegalonema sp.]
MNAKGKLAKAGLVGAVAALGLLAWAVMGDRAETQETTPQPIPKPKIGAVDWEAAKRDGAKIGRKADPKESEFAGAVTRGDAKSFKLEMPLLLPTSLVAAGKEGQLDQPLNITAEKYQYSAGAKAAPRSYLIQGTRFIFEVASIPDDEKPLEPGDIAVEKLEYGIEASFPRYGVMYSIAIFCDDPVGDAHCAKEDEVRRLAAEMELVK